MGKSRPGMDGLGGWKAASAPNAAKFLIIWFSIVFMTFTSYLTRKQIRTCAKNTNKDAHTHVRRV